MSKKKRKGDVPHRGARDIPVRVGGKNRLIWDSHRPGARMARLQRHLDEAVAIAKRQAHEQ